MQVFTVFEGQKRTSTNGADAQTNGGVALYTIERDVRMAGYGFSIPGVIGCTTKRFYNGANITPLVLTPITIVNGANGAPDTVTSLSSSKGTWSIPGRITGGKLDAASDNFYLNSTLGMAVNDFVVAYEAGKTCTLMQVTKLPSGYVQVYHENATSLWNPPASSQTIFPSGGYSTNALLLNLGSIVQNSYSLDANSNLQLSSYAPANNSSNTQVLISNVVNLQAQYGFDTRTGTVTDARVDTWSDTMIDADHSGTIGDSGDIGRIYAVRLAVAIRSPLMEKPQANGTCNTTTATSNNAPKWTGGAIDVSKNPDGSANANWMCYRYKVFETVIPLRNALWREA
jgi:type IV pilus assembly protein PilW